MSANFYELLKYAATGIASPSMTYYDRMRASMLMGGAVQTLTGIPPLTFIGNGTPLISWSMKGNAQQTGTPTPDAPIQPTFCGVRTAQLFDVSSVIYGTWTNGSGVAYPYSYAARSIDIPSSQITVSFNGSAFPYSYSIVWVDSDGEFIIWNHIGSATQIKEPQTFTPPSNAAKFYVQISNGTDNTNPITEAQIESYKLMLNLGSTALPYEPYGYKIPITCAGQTVPVYLGQTQTVRKIRKLVLDGTERWLVNWRPATGTYATLLTDSTKKIDKVLCTHLELKSYDQLYYADTVGVSTVSGSTYLIAIRVPDTIASNDTEFKAWLAAQYAAGTPVTVWYVLAEQETGIVNEPLYKIGDYCDELTTTTPIPTAKGSNTLSVDTTVQPSDVSITGNIKPTT